RLTVRKLVTQEREGEPAGSVSREEIVHQAIKQLGAVSNEDLAAFVEREHGFRIEPRFVPVFRASLRAKELTEQARAKAREALAAQPTETASNEKVGETG